MNFHAPARPTIQLDYHFRARESDRRRYRKNVVLLVLLQMLVFGMVMLAVRMILSHPWLKGMEYLEPLELIVPAVFAIGIWVCGIHVAFRRDF